VSVQGAGADAAGSTLLGRVLRNPTPYVDKALYLGGQRSHLVFAAYLARVELSSWSRGQPIASSVRPVLQTLKRDGIAVLPGLLSGKECDAILQDTLQGPRVEALQGEGVRVLDFPQYGTTRVLGLDRLSATARSAFCTNRLLQDAADAYARGAAPVFQTFVERKRADAPCGELESWHFDGFDKRFKAFVYLCDVDEDNGPFEYLLGSHTMDWRKFRKFYRWHRSRGREPASHTDQSHYLGREADDVLSRYRRQTVTRPRGTVFVFDGRGIHRGRTLTRGERLIAANYYRLRNF
jgi:hypothetical protein